jgi:hypothetical protein
MPPLAAILQNRTYRELRVIAGAYTLPFNNRRPKPVTRNNLHDSLSGKTIRRVMCDFSTEDRYALACLQASDGVMPLYQFKMYFGDIRPYKPWRNDDAPAHPWRYPVSSAEKLWQLAFIGIEDGKPDKVVLTDEARALLPTLPRPRVAMWRKSVGAMPLRLTKSPLPQTTLTDMAVFLGTLLHENVSPQWGRWLPPWALRAVNSRLRIKEELDGVRSELQTKRIHLLHYLAHVAGLVDVQNDIFQPTRSAWIWLDMPTSVRWQLLLDAVSCDLQKRDSLWEVYRLPQISPGLWRELIRQLDDLKPGRAYKIASLVKALKPYLPGVGDPCGVRAVREPPLHDQIQTLLTEILSEIGLVALDGGAFYLNVADFPAPEAALVQMGADALWITLPAAPHLRAMVDVLAWAKSEQGSLCVDIDAVRMAYEKGFDVLEIVRTLAILQDAPLPQSIANQIAGWSKQAQKLQLRHMIVLSSPDSSLMNEIRSDWRLRKFLAEPLSPRHVVVKGNHAGTLQKQLEKRGHKSTYYGNASTPKNQDVIYLEQMYLALRVYQKLGRWISPQIRIAGEVSNWLKIQLANGLPDALEQDANDYVDQLVQMMSGKSQPQGGVEQAKSDAIYAAVKNAYDQRQPITIEYYSPARGEKTVRTIEPLMLYEHNGTQYIEAWCHLDDDTRTFRVDRILEVKS